MQTRLAHEGMMIGKIQDQNKFVLDNVKRLAGEPSIGDDMSDVSIGNEVHNHYEPTSVVKSGMGLLAKGLAAAAILAGGAGLGYMVAGNFVDTDTTYQHAGGLGTPPTE